MGVQVTLFGLCRLSTSTAMSRRLPVMSPSET
jgi:hypothetical protein